MSQGRVFGVEARDGVFFCTAMASDGTVRAMQVFPPGPGGVAQFLRFVERHHGGSRKPMIGIVDRTSVEGASARLAEAMQREGFRVCPVISEVLAGAVRGVPLDGGRTSRRAARAMLRRRAHGGSDGR